MTMAIQNDIEAIILAHGRIALAEHPVACVWGCPRRQRSFIIFTRLSNLLFS